MNQPVIVGHDPGNSGALVCLVGDTLHSYLQFTTEGSGRHKRLNTHAVQKWLHSVPDIDVFISEDLWGSEMNTPTANWKLSQAESAVNTVVKLTCTGVRPNPLRFAAATPQAWQKAILQGMPTNGREQIKKASAKWVSQKYSDLAPVLRVKARWDIADAACIAQYGLRLLKRGRL